MNIISNMRMTEAWYTFLAQMGEHRASIAFNNGFSEIANKDNRNFLLRVRVAMKTTNKDGLPAEEEFLRLREIDKALDIAVTNKGGIYVGRVTVDGYRHFFFYVDFDEANAENIIIEISNKFSCKLGFVYEIDSSKDGYWNDLYPTIDDWQVIRDMEVLEALTQHQDDPDIERKILHWAYFDSDHSAKHFVAWLKQGDYAVYPLDSRDDGKIKVGFSHIGQTNLQSITARTITLNRQALELQGEYDGWETVIKSRIDAQ